MQCLNVQILRLFTGLGILLIENISPRMIFRWVLGLDLNVLDYECDQALFTLFHYHAVKDVPHMLVDKAASVVLEQPLKFFLLHWEG
jgi:hypothetical protein